MKRNHVIKLITKYGKHFLDLQNLDVSFVSIYAAYHRKRTNIYTVHSVGNIIILSPIDCTSEPSNKE